MALLKSILLAEDNPNDVELVLNAFERNKLANPIISARDGREALDYLRREGAHAGRTNEDPVLVLLDMKMPKVDGLEVLREIKTDEKLKLIPVVMFTSSSEETDLLRSYRLGVNAYVVKPVDFMQFVEVIRELGVFWALINALPRIATAP